jgi:hypothetical protein
MAAPFQAIIRPQSLAPFYNTMQNLTTLFSACNASSIPYPTVFGATILDLSATLVQNYTQEVSDQVYYNHPSVSVKNVDYCNVTVTYTHEGQNDTVNVETWLPTKGWNERLQAVGGGGYVAGRTYISYMAMAGAIGEGYVASTTDAGLGASQGPEPWALNSPGNVNLYALQNLASVSLKDQSLIAKDIINSFYGRPAKYSYWSGCSQGGRQGLMLAQRYPEAYDGIAAGAPAINWPQVFFSTVWSQVVMSMTGQFPSKCELDAITEAAVASCDLLDGVADGLISESEKCFFDPFSMVGSVRNCTSTGKAVTISEGAAAIANVTWQGPRGYDGEFLWYGLDYQGRMTGSDASLGTNYELGVASITCSANGTCAGDPNGLGDKWLQYFVKKDPEWNYTLINSVEEYTRLFKASLQEFNSIIGSNNPDLSEYRNASGKIITIHGLVSLSSRALASRLSGAQATPRFSRPC